MARRCAHLAALALLLLAADPPAVARAVHRDQITASIDLEAQTSFVRPGEPFQIDVRIRADADSTVRVDVYPAVASLGEYTEAVLDPDSLRGRIFRVDFDERPITELAQPTGRTPLTVTTRVAGTGDSSALALDTAGAVHPVKVVVVEPDSGEVLSSITTFLVALPDPSQDPTEVSYPLSVAVVVPFAAPLATAADDAIEMETTDMARLRTIATALADNPGVPATLAPRPETIRALVRSAEGAGVVSALREALSGREVLASPLVHMDPSSWVEAGLMPRFAESLELGRRSLDSDLGVAATNATWLAEATLDEAALGALGELGVEQVVVSEVNLRPLDPPRDLTLVQPFHLDAGAGQGVVPAVQRDYLLSLYLGGADPDLAVHQLLAHLAVLHNDQPDIERGVPLVLPDQALTDAVYDALFEALVPRDDGSSILRAVTISELFAGVDLARVDDPESDGVGPRLVRELTPAPAEGLDETLGADLSAAERRIATYLSVVDRPGQAAELSDLLAIAVSDELGPAGRAPYLARVETAVAVGLSGIAAPDDQTITITARDAELPLTFTNAQDTDARVALLLESDRLEFPDGETQIVTLPPGESPVPIRVESRAAGQVTLFITVLSPDGAIVLDESSVEVRSTVFSGVGLVISAVALGFLMLWWGREIARSRRAKRVGSVQSHPARSRRDADELASSDELVSPEEA